MTTGHPSGDAGPDTGATGVIRRARRSFAVSMLILFAGLMAVAFAVVYRLNRDGDGGATISEIPLPAGAETISAVVADGKLTLAYRVDGRTTIRIVDARTGETLSEIAVGTGD